MYKVKIERLDDFGNGISHIDEKIVFVNDCLPDEVVNVEIIEEKKNFLKAKLTGIEQRSDKRIKPKCIYYDKCGGCQLQHLRYEDTIEYKMNKIKNLFLKNKLYNKDITFIKNKEDFYYRNKIELKVENGHIGFYQNKSHCLVEINSCIITKKCINDVLEKLKLCNLKDANIIIRANYNDEIILIVNTNDEFDFKPLFNSTKIVGIVLNDKLVYGENHFVEVINNLYFKVSYNAFFQVNEYICSKLFELISDNIKENEVLADLYCGVGTLSIVASLKARKVYGIEIVENAILDAILNAKINKRDNLYFMCGSVNKLLSKINDNLDTIIVDPPRGGLDKNTLETIIDYKPKKIIYVSCNPQTLMRDLKELNNYYDIDEVNVLDMFSYSYHVETVCILTSKDFKK